MRAFAHSWGLRLLSWRTLGLHRWTISGLQWALLWYSEAGQVTPRHLRAGRATDPLMMTVLWPVFEWSLDRCKSRMDREGRVCIVRRFWIQSNCLRVENFGVRSCCWRCSRCDLKDVSVSISLKSMRWNRCKGVALRLIVKWDVFSGTCVRIEFLLSRSS